MAIPLSEQAGRAPQALSPAPVDEVEWTRDQPPEGELGSSFSWDHPIHGFEDGLVYGDEEPLVRDYQHMLDTDGKAAAIELMLTYPIISAPWSIEPAKGDTGEAEFIYDALTALPHQGGPMTTVEQMISQMTSAFTNKRAYFEKVYKLNDDEKVVYHKLAYRPPETCQPAFDPRRAEHRGFRQMPIVYDSLNRAQPVWNSPETEWTYVAPQRAFMYVHGTWRDPLFGESAMKVPYWCFQTKRKIRWLWYQFLDSGVLPKTVVKNPDETQARLDAKKVAQLKGKGVVALVENTTVDEYGSSNGLATREYQSAMDYLDNEMLDSGLLGFMGLSSAAGQGKGSYALAESLSKMYLRTRRMVAMDMARQITNDVIGPLIVLNFGPKASVPRFKFGPLSESNERDVLDVFSKVATTGAKVPVEFYDQLIARVAQLLELDPGKVAKAIQEEGSPQEPDNVAQQLGMAVQGATNLVQKTQAERLGTPTNGTVGQRPFEGSVVNK